MTLATLEANSQTLLQLLNALPFLSRLHAFFLCYCSWGLYEGHSVDSLIDCLASVRVLLTYLLTYLLSYLLTYLLT